MSGVTKLSLVAFTVAQGGGVALLDVSSELFSPVFKSSSGVFQARRVPHHPEWQPLS